MKVRVVIAIVVLSLISCAKFQEPEVPGGVKQDVLEVMSSILRLPVPDNAYSFSSQKDSSPADSNVKNLVANIDTVATELREYKTHFTEVVKDGAKLEGVLHIVHEELKAKLIGKREDDKQLVNWVYSVDGRIIFTGTQSFSGLKGDLKFSNTLVQWHYSTSNSKPVITITLREDTDLLQFLITYSAANVKTIILSGHINGNLEISGQWDAVAGGFYQEGAKGLKFCWNSSLQNINCP